MIDREVWPDVVTAAVRRCTEYLLHTQDSSGLWLNEVTGMTATTALYLLVLDDIHARQAYRVQAERAVDWLLSNQQPNGAWGERLGIDHHLHVYTNEYTALALLALRRFLRADAPAIRQGERFLEGRLVGGEHMRDPFVRLLFNLYGGSSQIIERRYMPMPLSALPAWVNSGHLPATTEAIMVATALLMTQHFQQMGQAEPGDAELAAWCLERLPQIQTPDGGWQAVVMTALVALKGLCNTGLGPDHPCIRKALDYLACVQNADGGLPIHSGLSVWETALAAIALRCAEIAPNHPALLRVADALMNIQLASGSWGWEHTPGQAIAGDVDDTSVALLALCVVDHPGRAMALRRGVEWLKEHQSVSGGWATFDAERDDLPLDIARAQVDTTAHAIEALVAVEGPTDPTVVRGCRWLLAHQRQDGAWRGYWFARYVYGTMSAICALSAAHCSAMQDNLAQAVHWLVAGQRADGGWGEDADGRPWHSSVEQTAWAVHGLLSAGESIGTCAVRRGVAFMLERLPVDSMWPPASVGTYTSRFAGAYGTRLLPVIHGLLALSHYQNRAIRQDGLPILFG